jgi:hypothetical protein
VKPKVTEDVQDMSKPNPGRASRKRKGSKGSKKGVESQAQDKTDGGQIVNGHDKDDAVEVEDLESAVGSLEGYGHKDVDDNIQFSEACQPQ